MGEGSNIKHRENRKTLPKEHLISCQGVKMFLLKDHFKVFFLNKFRIVKFQVLSQFEFFEFFHNLSFEFCHNLSS